jgi:hypothetical protein
MKLTLLLATLLVPALALGDAVESLSSSESVTSSSSIEGHRNLRQSSDTERVHQQLTPTPIKKPMKRCSSTNDCNADSYCAAGGCLAMGSCETNVDCHNPSNLFPTITCVGGLRCNKHLKCDKVCGSPWCVDGSMSTSDLCPTTPPCEIAESICKSTTTIASCKDDYCGGCNALVFDAAGNHELCIGPVDAGLKPCSSTTDCASDGSEYCSTGTCLATGKCTTDADCFNPENTYPIVACVGETFCTGKGQCGKSCTG